MLIFHEEFSYLMLCNMVDNLECQNHNLEFVIEKWLLSCEDLVERLFNGRIWFNWDAIYIASSSSSSSQNTDFIKVIVTNFFFKFNFSPCLLHWHGFNFIIVLMVFLAELFPLDYRSRTYVDGKGRSGANLREITWRTCKVRR